MVREICVCSMFPLYKTTPTIVQYFAYLCKPSLDIISWDSIKALIHISMYTFSKLSLSISDKSVIFANTLPTWPTFASAIDLE